MMYEYGVNSEILSNPALVLLNSFVEKQILKFDIF